MATQAAARGAEQEDVIEGDLVVRHSLTVRVAHWWTALFFVLAFLSGAALFSPRFYFLTNLFGGGYPTRQLHPWFSLFFIAGLIPLFRNWAGEMAWTDSDSRWMKNFKRYMRHEDLPEVGKFNAGQKLFFWAAALGGVVLLLSGVVMWFPTSFPIWVRYLAYPLHEILFILFGVAIVYHLYITLFALGGTLRAMTRGTVTKNWASSHHPRWYEEVNRK
ncbi:MAG TPA: formate dehydrogenase subunit gamma [Candidatus Binatia bacterium]